MRSSQERSFVLSLDVGTTGIRAFVYEERGRYVAGAYRVLPVLHPRPGWVELDADTLFRQAVGVLQDAMARAESEPAAGFHVSAVRCLGIATQRGSFTLWDPASAGTPLCNIICWNDLRSEDLCAQWNRSWAFFASHTANALGYRFTRRPRFLVHSNFQLRTQHVSSRLAHVFAEDPHLHELARQNRVCFGTIDTYLVYRLTHGEVHATDFSNASSTGLYEPFLLQWNSILLRLLGIPQSILPEIRNTCDDYGATAPEFLGRAIPITAVVGDQQAALFAEGCFRPGDVKITVGTGTFVCLNTGPDILASARGVWPLIAWKIGDRITYMQEGSSSAAGSVVDWARQELGLFDDPAELTEIATSVPSSEGVVFVPALAGLGAPYLREGARGMLWGATIGSKRAHIVRALVEGLAHQARELFDIMRTDFSLITAESTISVDGGVSRCDFLSQSISDLIGLPVVRYSEPERKTALGAAYLAGLFGHRVWSSLDDLIALRSGEKLFKPEVSARSREACIAHWNEAVSRVLLYTK